MESDDDPLFRAVLAGEAPLSVYADWLEERSGELAEGFRWLAVERRWPYTWSGYREHVWFPREAYPDLRNAPYFLPQQVFGLLDNQRNRTATGALVDAAAAYVTLATGRVPTA